MPAYLIAAWTLLVLSFLGYMAFKKFHFYKRVTDVQRKSLIFSSGTSFAIGVVNLPWTNHLIQTTFVLLLSSFFTWLLLYEEKIAGLDMWLTWKLVVPIDHAWDTARGAKKLEESEKYAKQARSKANTLRLFLPLLELLPCTDNLNFHAPLRVHQNGCDVLFNPDP